MHGGDWDGADEHIGGGEFALLADGADQPILFHRGEFDAGDYDSGGAVSKRPLKVVMPSDDEIRAGKPAEISGRKLIDLVRAAIAVIDNGGGAAIDLGDGRVLGEGDIRVLAARWGIAHRAAQ